MWQDAFVEERHCSCLTDGRPVWLQALLLGVLQLPLAAVEHGCGMYDVQMVPMTACGRGPGQAGSSA
jgi:hypothetical protein